MKRAQLNYAVDALIAIAFAVCAITGILFMLPPGAIRALGLGMPGMLGVSLRTWHWLHDWSGVAATVGVLLHSALHYRWIVAMTRRTFGAAETPARRADRGRPAAPVATLASSQPRAATGLAAAAARPPAGRLASPGNTSPSGHSTDRADSPRSRDQRRITRRRFVAGAAAGLGVAILGGGLFSRLGAVAANAPQGSGGAPAAGGTTTPSSSGSATQSSGAQAQSSGGATGSAGNATQSSGDLSGTAVGGGGSGSATQSGSTAAVLVSVDTSACVGCGRCLSVCPAGVFAWDAGGSHAVARNAARCIRCHRCLQTCPANAITVNG
jgi:NAD-dependent dihydropyrimidine dehydrogenase PreA subunit